MADNGRRPRVAVAGCGVVGGALTRLLAEHRARREAETFELVRVLVRDADRPRDAALAAGVLTTSVDDFLAAQADVVVEAVGGLEPAARIARETLQRGAHFVTANKALVAARGGELAALARARGATFRFDAAVGGGVPVLRLIESALGNAPPRAVRGILNGTSNFVLTLLERGATLDEALRDARARGFAEADATRDLNGQDAEDKLRLIAWQAFGIAPERLVVRRRGLVPDVERLARLANAAGGTLRHVAECACDEGDREPVVVASVEPVIVPSFSALGRTLFEENRVEIDSGWSTPLAVSGPGAGGRPTATAVLSDLLALATPTPLRQRRVSSRADNRPGRWCVAARVSPAQLESALLASRIVAEARGRTGGDAWVGTAAVVWPALEPVLTALADVGAAPVAARLDEGLALGAADADRRVAGASAWPTWPQLAQRGEAPARNLA